MSLVFFNLKSSSICHNFHYIIITFSIKKVLSVISRFCLFYSCLFQSSRYILINQVDIRVDDMLQKKIKCCLSAPGGCGVWWCRAGNYSARVTATSGEACHVPRAACRVSQPEVGGSFQHLASTRGTTSTSPPPLLLLLS